MPELLDLPLDIIGLLSSYLSPDDRDSLCATCTAFFAIRQGKRLWECPDLLPILNEIIVAPRDRFVYWYTLTQKQVCRGSERFLCLNECLIRSAKHVNPKLFGYFLCSELGYLSRAVYFIGKRGSLPLCEILLEYITSEESSDLLVYLLEGIVSSPRPNLQLLDRYVSITQTSSQIQSDLHSVTLKAYETDHVDVLRQIISTYGIDYDVAPFSACYNAMAKGGHIQKLEQTLTAYPNDVNLNDAIMGAVESGRIDLFESLISRLSNVTENLLVNHMNLASEYGQFEMVEHIHQRVSYDRLSLNYLIDGLVENSFPHRNSVASSSQSFHRGVALLSKLLLSDSPINGSYLRNYYSCLNIAIRRKSLSVIRLLLDYAIELSDVNRIHLTREAFQTGDIEIIDFILSKWEFVIPWNTNLIKEFSDNSVNSGRLLAVEYIIYQFLKRDLVPPITQMMKSAIIYEHLHICRYLTPYLPILTREETTELMDEALRQNNVPIAEHCFTFVSLDQLDMAHLLKKSVIYSCNETLDLLLEKYPAESDVMISPDPKSEQLTYNLFLQLKDKVHTSTGGWRTPLDIKRRRDRHRRIFEFIDRPIRKTSSLHLCSGITKYNRLCHRRVSNRKYCSIHASQEKSV